MARPRRDRALRRQLRFDAGHGTAALITWLLAAAASATAAFSLFGILHVGRSFFPLGSPARWIVLLVAIVVAIVLWIVHVSFAVRIRAVTRTDRPVISPAVSPYPEASQWIDLDARVFLVDAIGKPGTVTPRITESLAYQGRSLHVATSLTFAIPEGMRAREAVVPVLYRPRGSLTDKLEVSDSGGRRISTVGRESSAALLQAMADDLIRTSFAGTSTARRLLHLRLSAHTRVMLGAFDANRAKFHYDRLKDVIDAAPAGDATLVSVLRVFLGRMVEVAPVLVVLRPDHDESAALGGSLIMRRVSVAQLVSPRYRPLSTPSPSRGRRIVRNLLGIPVWVRGGFGVREPVIRYSLDNADRAASYHVQISAPEDMYIADARVRPAWVRAERDELISAAGHANRPRDGQPVAHFYARGASGFAAMDFVARFRESPPGSAGEAMIAAVGLAAVLFVLYVFNGSSEFVDILGPVLLAGLGTGSIWRGVVHTRVPFGGEIAARVSSIIAMVIALVALIAHAIIMGIAPCAPVPTPLGCEPITREATILVGSIAGLQPWLIAAATLNAIAILVSWAINVRTEIRLVNFGELPLGHTD